MGKAIGIDLGTTNSVMAHLERGQPMTIYNLNNNPLMPSVVGRTKFGERVVGAKAKRDAHVDPVNTIYSIKRFIGRSYSDRDVQRDMERVPYKLRESADGEVEVAFGPEYYSPAEISSFILKALRDHAAEKEGDISHAVITVPAYFGQRERHATRVAGQLAGLKVMHILPEPTAAALAYGFNLLNLQSSEPQHLLVYDLGGGTFDVTVLFVCNGLFEDLAKTGDMHLGGDDFDHRIVEWALPQARLPAGVNLQGNAHIMQAFKDGAEAAKIALSEMQTAEVNVPALLSDGLFRHDIEIPITRDEYNALIAPDIKRTVELTYQAIHEANLTPDEIDHVLLVGGSSMTPKIVETMRAAFGPNKVKRTMNPMECVAHGAAIQTGLPISWMCPKCRTLNEGEQERCQKCGAPPEGIGDRPVQQCPACRASNPVGAAVCRMCGEKLGKVFEGVGVTERTPLPLGIQTIEDAMEVVVDKGTIYPTPEAIKRHFQTSRANQDFLRVPVYEGMEPVASENNLIGYAEGPLPPGLPDGADVTVSFLIDRDGILYIEAFVTNRPDAKIEARIKYSGHVPSSKEETPAWKTEATNVLGMVALTLQHGDPYLELSLLQQLHKVGIELQNAINSDDEGTSRRKSAEAMALLDKAGFVQVIALAEAIGNADFVPFDQRQQVAAKVQRVQQAHRAGNAAGFNQAKAELAGAVQAVMQNTDVPDPRLRDLLRSLGGR